MYSAQESDFETDFIIKNPGFVYQDFYDYNHLYKKNNNLICDEAYSIDSDEQSEIFSLHSNNNSLSEEENNLIKVSGINEFSQSRTDSELALLNLHYRSNNSKITSEISKIGLEHLLIQNNQNIEKNETEKYRQMKKRKVRRTKFIIQNQCENSMKADLLEDKRPIDVLLKYINGEYKHFINENGNENNNIKIQRRKKNKDRQNPNDILDFNCHSYETSSTGTIDYVSSITDSSNDGVINNHASDGKDLLNNHFFYDNLSSESNNYVNIDLTPSISNLEQDSKFRSTKVDHQSALENIYNIKNLIITNSNNNNFDNLNNYFTFNSGALKQDSFNINGQICDNNICTLELSKDNLILNTINIKSSVSMHLSTLELEDKSYDCLSSIALDPSKNGSSISHISDNHIDKNSSDKKNDFVTVKKKRNLNLKIGQMFQISH